MAPIPIILWNYTSCTRYYKHQQTKKRIRKKRRRRPRGRREERGGGGGRGEEIRRQGGFDGESTFERKNDTLKNGMTLDKTSIHFVIKTKRQIKFSYNNFSIFVLKTRE